MKLYGVITGASACLVFGIICVLLAPADARPFGVGDMLLAMVALLIVAYGIGRDGRP